GVAGAAWASWGPALCPPPSGGASSRWWRAPSGAPSGAPLRPAPFRRGGPDATLPVRLTGVTTHVTNCFPETTIHCCAKIQGLLTGHTVGKNAGERTIRDTTAHERTASPAISPRWTGWRHRPAT